MNQYELSHNADFGSGDFDAINHADDVETSGEVTDIEGFVCFGRSNGQHFLTGDVIDSNP